jgi:hypothetical protein
MTDLKLAIRIVFAVSLCFRLAEAQDQSAGAGSKSKKGESQQAASSMPKASPEMQKLVKTLAGSWTTSERFEASDMMPKGGTGNGHATFRPGPGGLSLVEDYRSRGGMGAFAGHGVIWWDANAQGYKSVWCDNMSPVCQVANGLGKWEGNDLVFNDEMEMEGKKTQMKEAYTDIKSSSMTMTMDTAQGGPMKRFLTIKYKRQGAAASESAKTTGGQ